MARLLGDGVLIVWVDLKEEARREADGWYVEEHLPERIVQAGYLRARRFQAVADGLASPRYMALFEARTPAELAGDGYRRITAKINTRSQAMRHAFTRCIRSTHRRLACFGEGEGGVLVCARLRFGDAAQRERYEAWSQAGFTAWLASHRQVLSGHALAGAPDVRQVMDQFRQTGQDDEWADAVLLAELGQDADADAALLQMFSIPGLAAAGVPVAGVDTGIYRTMVSFTAR